MNYQEVLDRLGKYETPPSNIRNSYTSNREPYTRQALTARQEDSETYLNDLSLKPLQMTDRNYGRSSALSNSLSKAPIGLSPGGPRRNNARASGMANLQSARSPERCKVNSSSGEIDLRASKGNHRSSLFEQPVCNTTLPTSPIADIINKYSSPAKRERRTMDESAMKAFGYDRATFSHFATFDKDKENTNTDEQSQNQKKIEELGQALRLSVLERHKHLFKKQPSRTSSRESSRSSGCFQQKPLAPQVSAFSGKRRSSNQPNKSDFEIGKCMGDGKFGKVYPCKHKLTGTLYALKQIPKDLVAHHMMQDQLVREIKLHYFFNHNNIVRLYGFFSDETSVYLLMEYMEDGSLYSILKKNKKMPEGYVAERIKEITSALEYLHQLQVAHRDIKLENIVLSNGVAKLCDFGWAAMTDNRRTTYCGTFDYAPPEIIEGKEYNEKVDLWSLGVMTYQMLVGKVPFYHISRSQTMNNILNIDTKPISYPAQISDQARDFINSLLKKNPNDRMPAKDLMKHPFLASVMDYSL